MIFKKKLGWLVSSQNASPVHRPRAEYQSAEGGGEGREGPRAAAPAKRAREGASV